MNATEKKLVIALILGSTALGLAACGSGKEDRGPPASGSESQGGGPPVRSGPDAREPQAYGDTIVNSSSGSTAGSLWRENDSSHSATSAPR